MVDSSPHPRHNRTVRRADDDLQRFVAAQTPVYQQVLTELRQARKTSHWMWFVFPQLRGLGLSEMARYYGLCSATEAAAYQQHPVLGPRLLECTGLVVGAAAEHTVHDIFGSPDDLKLRSCITLFAEVADDPLFARALQTLFGGRADSRTLELLAH